MVVTYVTYFLSQIDPDASYTWTRLINSALKAPIYHLYFEFTLILGIIWLMFKRSYQIKDVVTLTTDEKRRLVEEWKPDSLVPKDWNPAPNLLEQFHRCAYGPLGKYVDFNPPEKNSSKLGTKCKHLNFATLNFLDFVGDKEINEIAIENMKKYGVGSCGPRGFYGTFDVHLELERLLAEFLGVEKSITYSYNAVTISSAIPSYAKQTDVIFADEGVSHAIYQGLVASRSVVKFFRHNDMDHLEHLLMAQAKKDQEDRKRALLTRRFLVVEGLYFNYGDICPLPKLVELKYKYKVRIIMDETVSFGVLGSTGRGVTEFYGIDIDHIDLISGSLETALGVCGGFCAGSEYVVGHQELSGQGYCFSASLPPMLASAVCQVIRKLCSADENGKRNRRLLELSQMTHTLFNKNRQMIRLWTMSGHPDSPIKHLRLRKNNTLVRLEAITKAAFEWICTEEDQSQDLSSPILLTVARYTFATHYQNVSPSIRVALNCNLTDQELEHLFHVLASVS